MKVQKRREQLEKRRQAWATDKARRTQGMQSTRYESGGYREPGSMKHY